MSRPRLRIFRWKAVGPLCLFLLILAVGWIVFSDRFARRLVESDLSLTLGTEVDVARLEIQETDAAVEIRGLAIADPRNRMRNLLEAGTIALEFDPAALLEKKIVVNQLRLSGLRLLTARKTPARPADPNSPTAKLLSEVETWARDKFQFPKVALGRIDTLKSLLLDPEQLATVQAAKALLLTIDSVRSAFEQGVDALQLKQVMDSSAALVSRLAKTDPKSLGLIGLRNTVASVQEAVDRVKQARDRLQALEQAAKSSLGELQQSLQDVNAARLKDYAFARGLLELPNFGAPDIGASLFGEHSVDYFQQALYYVKALQRYVPPGLRPWSRPGFKRLRRAGTTVEFPKAREYPRFLLRRGDFELATGSAEPSRFKASVTGITSQPALLGRPATLVGSGALGGDSPVFIELSALSRHFGSSPKDSVEARVTGVPLPAFPFPGLPFSVDPGNSSLGFGFSLAGDRLAGWWEIRSSQVSWAADSARLRSASLVESTIWRVISGLTDLTARAELGGTIANPTLQVRSNLDNAIAARLRALVGEELARAELKARAAVDTLVAQQLAVLEARVNELASQTLARLLGEKTQLEQVEQLLRAQLRRLAAGLTGVLRLPE